MKNKIPIREIPAILRKMPLPQTAFVLGAGLGTRLRPLTDNCPKPLLPIHGRPMITYVFDHLINAGIRRLIVNTHHAAGHFADVFPDGSYRGIPMLFRHEPVLLGTAGGLKNIEDLLATDDPLLLHSGDVVTTLPLEPLLQAHTSSGAESTLALRTRPGVETVGTDPSGAIRHIGKPPEGHSLAFHDYANVALIEPAFLTRIPDTQPRDLASVWRSMIADGGNLQGCVINEGAWHNVGTPEEYQHINAISFP